MPWAIKRWQHIPLRDYGLLAVSAFIGVSGHIVFLYFGLTKTSSINTAVIVLLGPIILYAMSIELLREKVKRRTLLGIIVAFSGAFLIIVAPLLRGGGQLTANLTGNILILLAVISAQLGVITAKRLLKRINIFQFAFLQFSIGSLPLGIMMVIFENPTAIFSSSSTGFATYFYGAVIGIFLAHVLFYHGLRKVKAEDVGPFGYLEPVFTVLVAIPLLHEYPDGYFVIGALLVFVGVALAQIKLHPHLHLHSYKRH